VAAPRGEPIPPSPDVLVYSRREIARRFAELLEVACAHGSRQAASDPADGSLVPSGLTTARSTP